MNYEELNKEATKELKELLQGNPNVEFTDEKPTGFYLSTKAGRFWFECEVDSVEDDFIEYHGIRFPVREIQLSEDETVLVGTETLERALIDPVTSQYTDDEAKEIDEQIYFFAPDDMITRGDDELTEFVKQETDYEEDED